MKYHVLWRLQCVCTRSRANCGPLLVFDFDGGPVHVPHCSSKRDGEWLRFERSRPSRSHGGWSSEWAKVFRGFSKRFDDGAELDKMKLRLKRCCDVFGTDGINKRDTIPDI